MINMEMEKIKMKHKINTQDKLLKEAIREKVTCEENFNLVRVEVPENLRFSRTVGFIREED